MSVVKHLMPKPSEILCGEGLVPFFDVTHPELEVEDLDITNFEPEEKVIGVSRITGAFSIRQGDWKKFHPTTLFIDSPIKLRLDYDHGGQIIVLARIHYTCPCIHAKGVVPKWTNLQMFKYRSHGAPICDNHLLEGNWLLSQDLNITPYSPRAILAGMQSLLQSEQAQALVCDGIVDVNDLPDEPLIVDAKHG